MIYIVAVTEIYENPGVVPSQARINQRNNDRNLASQRSDAYAPGGTPPTDEYLTDLPDRYGLGWRAQQFISVVGSAVQLGTTVYNQMLTRNLKPGSYVQVFPDSRDEGGAVTTGEPVFQRYWPRANPPVADIG